MPLTVEDLLRITEIPKKENINLTTIAEFYEKYICNRIFHYHLRYDKQRDVKIRFKTSDLPHLLGIQYFNFGSSYTGTKGFPALKSGDITLDLLKKSNEGEYFRILYRILYFPFVAQLMYNAKALVFWPDKNKSAINAEFMFHDMYHGRHIHLGTRKEESKSKTDEELFYVPVTFVERGKVFIGRSIQVESVHVIDESKLGKEIKASDELRSPLLESAADNEEYPQIKE